MVLHPGSCKSNALSVVFTWPFYQTLLIQTICASQPDLYVCPELRIYTVHSARHVLNCTEDVRGVLELILLGFRDPTYNINVSSVCSPEVLPFRTFSGQ